MRRKRRVEGKAAGPVAVTLLLMAASASAIWLIQTSADSGQNAKDRLVVYCAAGNRAAVEPILQAYEREYGVAHSLHFGPSGALATQVELSGKGDLFLPAAVDPYLTRMRGERRVAEVIPIARLELVLAFSPQQPDRVADLPALLASNARYGFCNEQAAAGQRTRATLEQSEIGRRVLQSPTATFLTVTELAGAIRDSGRLDAGIVWDTTAKQYGLDYVKLPELASSVSTIGVGVLETSKNPQAALRLARYLAATDRGQPLFEANHYTTTEGDLWAETPELTLFSGPLNRNAIKDTLLEFESREGCKVTTVFDGCRVLVDMMKAGATPDAYLGCDASCFERVGEQFHTPTEIADHELVMLVRKGNPRNVQSLSDLAQESLRVGVCDPELIALGSLTRRLLEQRGAYQRVVDNRAITATDADQLVAQMLAGDKIDAAIVYEANGIEVLDRLDQVRIDAPLARAVQTFSVHRNTEFPLLTERLRAHLTSEQSAARFRDSGFDWRAAPGAIDRKSHHPPGVP